LFGEEEKCQKAHEMTYFEKCPRFAPQPEQTQKMPFVSSLLDPFAPHKSENYTSEKEDHVIE